MSDVRFDMAANALCQNLSKVILKIHDEVKSITQEIRLRLNRPVAIITPTKTYYLLKNGCITNTVMKNEMLLASQRDIVDTFQNICNYSVYSRQNEIKNGYITLSGGHRAGICGTAVYSGNEITNIRDISSINIRISREVIGCANSLIHDLNGKFDGLLLCGPPASGKTTILRDMARQLSESHNKKVAVIDERGELAGTSGGVFQNDLGQSDILDNYKKGEGIMQAVRCLSPDIVICDEVGTKADIEAIEEGLNTGVSVIASIHASSFEELLRREQAKSLLKTGAFKKIIVLKCRENTGEIKEIINEEDIEKCFRL
ncbi:MAG: ATPase, T2SS/T4P/T4SS family [Bacillota bacterium]|nr:ATPase, T2SS/T4P/T4SS family [Bacillota bacterium]